MLGILAGVLMSAAFSLVPILAVIAVVRSGPIPNRWWRGERPLGFGLFVGLVGFALGFFGPMILTPEANQGPMLGIFITGPGAFVAGIAWGAVRAARRREAETARS